MLPVHWPLSNIYNIYLSCSFFPRFHKHIPIYSPPKIIEYIELITKGDEKNFFYLFLDRKNCLEEHLNYDRDPANLEWEFNTNFKWKLTTPSSVGRLCLATALCDYCLLHNYKQNAQRKRKEISRMCNTKNHFIATSESHLEIVHWPASAGLSAGLLLSPPNQGTHQ